MSYEQLCVDGLDYLPCRYGKSKLLFRGPRKRLDDPYIAMVGGSEIYGKYIEDPVSEILESTLGKTVVNLGVQNAGVDAFINDPSSVDVMRRADAVILQVMGAQNMSNRLYTVHPRRNDRFLNSSQFLQTLYRNVDFTQFHYTRHLLTELASVSEERFELVVEELQTAWSQRMIAFIKQIGRPIYLLWIAAHEPNEPARVNGQFSDTLYVSQNMVEALSNSVRQTIKIVATPDEIEAGASRMIFSPMEQPIAQEMLGPIVHQRAAHTLAEILRKPETRDV